MNDDDNVQQQPFLDKPAAAPPANAAEAAGAMLRQAREAAGVHLAALAVSLKVPPARLEALEAGRIDLLPDPVFARALAASICRTLKLDPEPVLKQLPRTGAAGSSAAVRSPAAAGDRQFEPPVASPSRTAAPRAGLTAKPFMIAALVLVLAALALVLVPDLNWDRLAGNAPATSGTPPAARPVEPSEKPATAALPPAATVPATPPATSVAAPAAGAPSAAGTAETAAPAAMAEKTLPAPAPTTPAAAPAPAQEAAAGDTVVFRTQSEAWISVIDAKGTSLLRKNVAAGQTVGVTGALPLRVTVGRSDVTQVSVRGEPLDLAPLSKGGVARFEVK